MSEENSILEEMKMGGMERKRKKLNICHFRVKKKVWIQEKVDEREREKEKERRRGLIYGFITP